MVELKKNYACDACRKKISVDPETEAKGWITTEVGDLCPSCARAWDNFKKSFIERMRKDNGESIVDC